MIAVAVFAGAARRAGRSAPLVLVVVGVVASLVPGRARVPPRPRGRAHRCAATAALRGRAADLARRRARQPAGHRHPRGRRGHLHHDRRSASWPGRCCPRCRSPPAWRSAPSSHRRTPSPQRPSRAASACPDGWCRSSRARACSTTPRRWSRCARRRRRSPTAIGVWTVLGDFVLAVGGRRSPSGSRVAAVLAAIRKRRDDPVLDTTLSFIAPFLAYLPAEAIHASGVLAVVVTGLILGHKSPVLQSASSRLSEQTNWRTVQFVLENAVFLIIGLQVPDTIRAAWDSEVGHDRVVLLCVAVLARDDRRPGRVGLRRDGDLPPRTRRGCGGTPGPGRTRPWSRGRGCAAWSRWPRPSRSPRRHRRATPSCWPRSPSSPAPCCCRARRCRWLTRTARSARARRRRGRAAGGRVAVQCDPRRAGPARGAAQRRGRPSGAQPPRGARAVPRRLGVGAARPRQHVGRDTERDLPAAAAGDARRRSDRSCWTRATPARPTTRCCATC